MIINNKEWYMTNTEISQMSIHERLQTMEALWDSLNHEVEEIKPPQWHESVLRDRTAKIKNGNASFISLNELKNNDN